MQRRALIACDKFKIRADLTSWIGSQFTCDIAVNGQETLDLIKIRAAENEKFGLIIVDYKLNDIPGAELLATIRRMEEDLGNLWPYSARIVVMSETDKVVVSAFFRGAEACHIYPLNRERLIKQIAALEVERVYQ